jgi:hypothetical protein
VYGHNQINQSRNTLPGTSPSTLPGIRSTVLGGDLDVSARSLVVPLHTLLSVDAVQGATAGGWTAGRATGRAVHDGSRGARKARGPLNELVSLGGHGARTSLLATDPASWDRVGPVVAGGLGRRDDVEGLLDDNGLLADAQALFEGCEKLAGGEGVPGQLHPCRLAALKVHSREVLAALAEDVVAESAGAGVARFAECKAILVCLDSVGAEAAVAGMTLKVVDHQLLVVLEVTHDGERIYYVDWGRHCVGSA